MTASNERDPGRDRELDDYLAGRHALSRHYAQARVERPTGHDAAILAKAAAAAQAGTAKRGGHRWQPVLAVAATMVLGVAVGWNLLRTPAADVGADSDSAMGSAAPSASGDIAAPGSQKAAEAIRAEDAQQQRLAQKQASARAAQPRAQAFAAPRSLHGPNPQMAAPPPRGAANPSPPLISDDPQIQRLIDHVRELPDGTVRLDGKSLSGSALAEVWTQRWARSGTRCSLAADFVDYCALPDYEGAQIEQDGELQPLRPILHRWIRNMEHPPR
ncbi:hypothetical protein RM530_05125 [Algiphilus sp. W345]|uniref:Uncharacterized protein n=1 Tax=Banduia mediterranea TaxID=3075609 RepID=A0ABU2WFU5_9GAMM|nr:hypothetical protein [Algiphilus sp. W345]MDT0496744.1 hypothetical protein [Algiphilus sp. W345]